MSDMYDIDAILAEFNQYSAETTGQPLPQPETPKPQTPAPRYEAPAPRFEAPAPQYEPPRPREEAPAKKEPSQPQPRHRSAPPHKPAKPPKKAGSRRWEDEPEDEFEDDFDDEFEDEPREIGDEYPTAAQVKPRKLKLGFVRVLVGVICAAVTVACLGWLAFSLHPDVRLSPALRAESKMDLVSRINVFANNAKSDALGDLAYIRKIYTIDRSASCAPKPDEDRFSTYSIAEADRVMTEVVDKARQSGLLEGQEVIFDPAADFYWDSDIRCYVDDTIMVICWKENIERRVCSCVEVKIADASQFRRKLTEDYFGSSVLQYATQMAASVNAVTAMNADFYSFRPYGIVVYQGEIFRYGTSIDTLFIDDQGDFSFAHRYDDPGQEAMQQRIYENHVNFSLVFGPVLIEDGVVQHLDDNYGGLGEMNQEYSRAGIGQFDRLHYLYMTVNHSNDSTPRATVNQFADIIATKNLKQAYNLDGGQTSEEVFHGEPFNHVDFGEERLVSDIIYFGTAIPESEVSG